MDGSIVELRPRDVRFEFKHEPGEYWCGGDVFRTRFFDAFSTILPIAEQFFVESVRNCERDLTDPALTEQVRRFVLQEAAHAREHRRYNKHLRALGLDIDAMDAAQRRVLTRLTRMKQKTIPLAVVVAAEHLTAILCAAILRGELMHDAHPEMLELWRWHSIEEVEHKAVAFDVYAAYGGGPHLRRVMMGYIVGVLSLRVAARMTVMLKRDGELFAAGTWSAAGRFLFARRGLLRTLGEEFWEFFRKDFHPWDNDNSALIRAHEASSATAAAAT